jgi:hypothetical protein
MLHARPSISSSFVPIKHIEISVNILYKILFPLFFWYTQSFIDIVVYFRFPKDHGMQHMTENLRHCKLCLYTVHV